MHRGARSPVLDSSRRSGSSTCDQHGIRGLFELKDGAIFAVEETHNDVEQCMSSRFVENTRSCPQGTIFPAHQRIGFTNFPQARIHAHNARRRAPEKENPLIEEKQANLSDNGMRAQKGKARLENGGRPEPHRVP